MPSSAMIIYSSKKMRGINVLEINYNVCIKWDHLQSPEILPVNSISFPSMSDLGSWPWLMDGSWGRDHPTHRAPSGSSVRSCTAGWKQRAAYIT